MVVIGLAINSFWHQPSQVLGSSTDLSALRLLQQTNTARLGNDQSALTLNSQLAAAAQAKATDMVARDYWSHTTPDGKQPWSFVSDAGYHYVAIGENLAYGFSSSTSAVNGWMNSPPHRNNLLNRAYTDVGFGVADAPNYQGKGPQAIVVAMYGAPDISAAVQSRNYQINDTRNAVAPPSIAESVNSKDMGEVLPAREVTRLETKMDAGPWIVLGVATVAALSMMAFILKQGLIWRRVLSKGEAFANKYHLLDVVLVAVGILGFIVTRSAGTIQ